jgi:hypothetical protein
VNGLSAAAEAVVSLILGGESDAKAPCKTNEQRAWKRQRTRLIKREETDPHFRSHCIETNRPLGEKPFTELERMYVTSTGVSSDQASEQAAKREELFASIVLGLFRTAVQYGMPGISVHDAYLTEDPETLRITLGQLLEVSVPPHRLEHARLAVTGFLSSSCADKLFAARSARQILKTSLRTLCGITTRTPHFEFIRRGARRDDASTADILAKFSASPPQLTRDIAAAASSQPSPRPLKN